MATNIKYDKDKVWQNIVKKQKKEKRRRFLIWFFVFAGIGLGGMFLAIDKNQDDYLSTDLAVTETPIAETEKPVTDSPTPETTIRSKNNLEIDPAQIITNNSTEENKAQKENTRLNTELKNKEKTASQHAENQTTPTIEKEKIRNQEIVAKNQIAPEKIMASSSKDDKLTKTSASLQNSDNVTAAQKSSNKYADIIDELKAIEVIQSELIHIDNYDFSQHNIPSLDATVSLDEGKDPISLFVMNTISMGSSTYDGPASYMEQRNDKERLNFVNRTTIGVELPINDHFLLQSGLQLDIISTTYDYEQDNIETIETSIEHDTAIIYNNSIVAGRRPYTEVVSRHIRNHNETIKIGIPIMLGYKKKLGSWDIRAMVGTRVNFAQSFRGIISNDNGEHLLDNQLINATYYKNDIGLKLASQLLLTKSLSDKSRLLLGCQYSAAEFSIANKNPYRQDYKGFGLSLGYSVSF